MVTLLQYDDDEIINLDLYKLISKIAVMLNYDICKLILLNDKKDYGIVVETYQDTSIIKEDYKDVTYISKETHANLLKSLNEDKNIITCNFSRNSYNSPVCSSFLKNVKNELYIPLILDTEDQKVVIGCLYLGSLSEIKDDILQKLSDYRAMTVLKLIENQLQIIYESIAIRKNFLNTLHIFSEILREKEPFVVTHPYNVAYWCNYIAEEYGFDSNSKYRLYMAAILHDIGKSYISQLLLNKKDRLTEEEYEILKMHSIYGYNIVKDLISGLDSLNGIDEIVRYHHERYDGTGYPEGLHGENIPLESRIIAVADAVDTMLSERCYKKSKPIPDTIKELIKCKGTQFDPMVADSMIKILLNADKTYDNVILDPILWGTLIINANSCSYSIQGTLIKTQVGYKFKSDFEQCIENINIEEVKDASIIIERGKKIFEYKANINYINKNKIYISISALSSSNQNSILLWELHGRIKISSEFQYDVNISKIGMDVVTFYGNKDGLKELNNNTCSLEIIFQDGSTIEILGKIIKTYEIAYKVYFDFEYVDIDESNKNKTLEQIFKRQEEYRKKFLRLIF